MTVAARCRPAARMAAGGVLWMLVGIAGIMSHPAAQAAETVRIAEIAFEGNDVTQPRTMLREISLAAGQVVDAAAIDDARQSILDLGLFRSVDVRREPAADGERITFVVREKWYLLPLPRLDGNSDGRLGYGMALNWDNVWGLNHRIRALVTRTTYEERAREAETVYRATYEWPLVADSPWSLWFTGERSRQSSLLDELSYEEHSHALGFGVVRKLDPAQPSNHGWTVGAGLMRRGQRTVGEVAPPSDGKATLLEGQARYRDVRFNVYSETGHEFSVQTVTSVPGLGDYDLQHLRAQYARYWRVGERAHQTAHLIVAGGTAHAGPAFKRDTYALGGSSTLRGYDNENIEGDSYLLVAGEFLRPMFSDSTRLLLLAEVGSMRRSNRMDIDRPVYASVGVGLRLRLTWFVRLEVELGVALPLIDGDGLRVFAGSV